MTLWFYSIATSFFLLSLAVHAYNVKVEKWEYYVDSLDTVALWDSTWTHWKDGYWFNGLISVHQDATEDRVFRWVYARPNNSYYSNTDYDSAAQEWRLLPATPFHDGWMRSCDEQNGVSFAMFHIHSSHDNDQEDRQWDITCKQLPNEFTLDDCMWTDWQNAWDGASDFYCISRIFKSMKAEAWDDHNKDRRFQFECCGAQYYPMYDGLDVYYPDRLLTGIVLTYDAVTATRSISRKYWAKPKWYNGDIVANVYALTSTFPADDIWQRICPRNGALVKFEESEDEYTFECATLVNTVTAGDCYWTEFVNEFGHNFGIGCDFEGPIRGIESYYSETAQDRRFKLYCCAFSRNSYLPSNEIIIAAKSGSLAMDDVVTFTLCWNAYLYQGIMVMNAINTWFATDDVVKFDTCGNERALTIQSTSDAYLQISSVNVSYSGQDYAINGFNVYESRTSNVSNYQSNFTLSSDYDVNFTFPNEVIITYPDNYLIACVDGCTADLYDSHVYSQYLITITSCASFTIQGIPQIGIILRGLNGNLEKKTLHGPTFEKSSLGRGNIGALLDITLELESSDDFCIEEITLYDPFDGTIVFSSAHFGDGTILSTDCQNDGYFRHLSQIQFVPCHDTPFSIVTYAPSLYTSIQIHTCTAYSGLPSANSDLLSLTVFGLSKNNMLDSTDEYSLKSSKEWSPGTARDYTFVISHKFEKATFVTISNNDLNSALCVDSVLINGVEAHLPYYWVPFNTKPILPAVLQWPICDIEMTTIIQSDTPLPVDPQVAATATCVNQNRLTEVSCQISQTYQTSEQISWTQDMGTQTSHSVTIEDGTQTSTSHSHTTSGSFGGSLKAAFKKVTLGLSGGFGDSNTDTEGETRVFSTSTTDGSTTLQTKTDGRVNGKTIDISCGGSVSVPPSQEIEYTILLGHSGVSLTTLTDIKMTKCASLLYGDGEGLSEDDYIHIYGIEGTLNQIRATTCYISFGQATQVGSDTDDIDCAKESALATREWGTFVPQCEETNSKYYKKCQCAFGDLKTQPTCGCVDPSTGNLLDTDVGQVASVVPETDEYKWTDWCEERCGKGSYSLYGDRVNASVDKYSTSSTTNASYATESDSESNAIQLEANVIAENSEYNYAIYYVSLIATMALIAVTYCVNSLMACWKKRELNSNHVVRSVVNHGIVMNSDIETENENETQLEDATHPL